MAELDGSAVVKDTVESEGNPDNRTEIGSEAALNTGPGAGAEPQKALPWHLKQLNSQIKDSQKKNGRPKKKMTLQSVLIDLAKLYCFYVVLSIGLLYFFKDYLALFPYQDQDWKPMLADLDKKVLAKTEILTIPGPEGSKLSAVYTKSLAPGSSKLVVISHGNAGNVGHRIGIAAYFAACGVSTLNYDYRGFGESTGQAHLVGLVDDGLSAYNYATQTLGYKESDIILYGESIGCGITTGIMQKNHPGAVILQSPFTSLKTAARDKLFFLWCLPEFLMPPPALDNLTAVKGEHPRLLIMHGEKDTILPALFKRTLRRRARAKRTIYYQERRPQ